MTVKKNNNRADRGANRKAGNAPKLTAEQERAKLARELGLRPKTKEFIDKIIANPKMSHSEVYKSIHKTENSNTAKVEASKLLTKPNVRIYKDKLVRRAKERIGELVESDNQNIALKASQDVLDRTEGKAIQKTESTSRSVEVKLDLSGLRVGAHYINTPTIAPEVLEP